MAKKKKLDQEVIYAALNFDAADPESQDEKDRAAFTEALRTLNDLEAERDAWLAEKGLDKASIEYIQELNNWEKRHALETARDRIDDFRTKALELFAAKYGTGTDGRHVPELLGAYMALTEALILWRYEAFCAAIKEHGFTQDMDYYKSLHRNLSNELLPFLRQPGAPVAKNASEFEYVRLFGDIAIDSCVQYYTEHVAVCMPDNLPTLAAIRTDALNRKWDIAEAPAENLFKRALEAAEAYAETIKGTPTAPAAEYPTHTENHLGALYLSTTKPETSGLWDIYGNAPKVNYTTKRIGTPGNKRSVHILVCLDFSAMEQDPELKDVLRQLTPYDRRVFIVCVSLQKAGYRYITVTDIYKAMKKHGNMGAERLRIEQSIKKMSVVRIYIKNKEETDAHLNYPAIAPRWSYLLPIEGVWIMERGKLVWAYDLLKESALVELADGRKHVTNLTPKVLDSPNRQQPDIMLLESVLLDNVISLKHIAKDKGLNVSKIRLSKILKRCRFDGIDAKKRSRLITYAERYLDHLGHCGLYHNWKWGTSKTDGSEMLIFTFVERNIIMPNQHE